MRVALNLQDAGIVSSRLVFKLRGEKLPEDNEGRLVVALVCAFMLVCRRGGMLGFRTRATSARGLSIERQVIRWVIQAPSGHS